MAREHARLWLDINDDEDFGTLTFDAQGFYTRVILTLESLNYCGVADWRPRRLTTMAPDLTLDRILAAAAELEARNYLLFDLDTEEVLARSFIRRDELLRNPKMAATVIKGFAGIASKTLRAAVITEVQRVHREHPDYSSWSHKDTADGLARLLAKSALPEGGYAPQISVPAAVQNGDPIPVTNGVPYSVPNGIPDPVQNTNPGLGADHQSFSVGNPSTSTLHPSPAPLGGYVSPEGHQGDPPDPNTPPPRFCPEHPNGTENACIPCKSARQANARWQAIRDAEAEEDRLAATRRSADERLESASIRAQEVAECDLCDDDGYRNGQPCDHVDRTGVAEAGMAAVRAALAAKGATS